MWTGWTRLDFHPIRGVIGVFHAKKMSGNGHYVDIDAEHQLTVEKPSTLPRFEKCRFQDLSEEQRQQVGIAVTIDHS